MFHPQIVQLVEILEKNCYLIFLFSFWSLFFLFTWMLKSSAFFLWPSFTAQWNFFKMSFTEYNWKVKVKVKWKVKVREDDFFLKFPHYNPRVIFFQISWIMILKRGKDSWIGRFRYHYRKYNLNQIEVFLTQPGHISIICCNNVFFIALMKNCSLWLVAQLDHHHLSSSRKQRDV